MPEPGGDQVDVLGNAWRYLLPANSPKWSDPDTWIRDKDDPEMQWSQRWWKHSRALVDDDAIRRAQARSISFDQHNPR